MIHWEHKRNLNYLETPRSSKKNRCATRTTKWLPHMPPHITGYKHICYISNISNCECNCHGMVWNLSENARPPCWWHVQNWFKTYIPADLPWHGTWVKMQDHGECFLNEYKPSVSATNFWACHSVRAPVCVETIRVMCLHLSKHHGFCPLVPIPFRWYCWYGCSQNLVSLRQCHQVTV